MSETLKRFAISVVVAVSWFFRMGHAPRACRFYPSCSAYALEAFRRASFLKALGLSVKRVLSCHPFSAGGYRPFKGS